MSTEHWQNLWKTKYQDWKKYSQTWANDDIQRATIYQQLLTTMWSQFDLFNIIDPWIMTNCQQRLPFCGLKGGRCTQVLLYRRKFSQGRIWRKIRFWYVFLKLKIDFEKSNSICWRHNKFKFPETAKNCIRYCNKVFFLWCLNGVEMIFQILSMLLMPFFT